MKRYSLENIGSIAKKLKSKGKKIGLCHGVFDIIHTGHIDHFEEVKKKCDFLFVTITEDKHVNKGPNRPVNNHFFRAKILQSVKNVDYVAVNYSKDAVESILEIKPDYYFKGKDYKRKKDLTLRLQKEKKAVQKINGRLVFTQSPLKSSTEIINKSYSYIFDSKLQKYLSVKNRPLILKNCISQLEKIKKLKVLIIGDAIIDQYDTVMPLNKPIKENILATKHLKSDTFLGGVFAAAVNLSQFNNDITLCTAIGNDKDINNSIKNLPKNINRKIYVEKKKITTRKKRFVDFAYNKKISEIYFIDDDFLSKSNSNKINNYLKDNLKKFDVVIMIDYGHGFINKNIYKTLEKKNKISCCKLSD
jgi:rfaE bifunctional protein nucleotidyltransferase chain/domain